MNSEHTITIRRARLQDAEKISILAEKAFYQAFGAENTPENMAAYLSGAFSAEKQAAELVQPGSTFFLVELLGELIGYAHVAENPPPACITGSLPVEISRFYLLQNWIGQGKGSTLMQACLDEARSRGGDVAWLGVWEKNARAISFYKKWGFSISGTHEFMLGSELQQDYLMQRRLWLEDAPGYK